MAKPCSMCTLPGTLRCSQCKSALYCSSRHQRQHWLAGHKTACGLAAGRKREAVESPERLDAGKSARVAAAPDVYCRVDVEEQAKRPATELQAPGCGVRTAEEQAVWRHQARKEEPLAHVWTATMDLFGLLMRERQVVSLFSNARKGDEAHVKAVVAAHEAALQCVLELARRHDTLTPSDVRRVHGMLCAGLLADAGSFRLMGARVGRFVFPAPKGVSELVTKYCAALPTLLARTDLSVEGKCAWAILNLVEIHPFTDGNGRLGRLMGNYVLTRLGLPFVVSFCSSEAHRQLWSEAHKGFHLTKSPLELCMHIETCVLLAWDEFTRLRRTRIQAELETSVVSRPKAVEVLRSSNPCAICLDEAPDTAALCCGAAHHATCLRRWLVSGVHSCPSCRAPIAWDELSPAAEVNAGAAAEGNDTTTTGDANDVVGSVSDSTTTSAVVGDGVDAGDVSDTTTTSASAGADEPDSSDTTSVVPESDVCMLCQTSKWKEDFSFTQWTSKAVGCRKCRECVQPPPAPVVVNDYSDSTTAVAVEDGDCCLLCGHHKPQALFSLNQWFHKPAGLRKCKTCLL